MATTQTAHVLEIEQCLHILDEYIGILDATSSHKICRDTMLAFLKDGILQVSTIFEKISAHLAGCTVVQRDEADLCNGADCKMVSVRTSGYGRLYRAPVTGTKNKTGTLYVYVYERKQAKHYYFAIPYSAHRQIAGLSNIEIPFELDGTPRRIPGRPLMLPNWWNFECASLEEMCAQPGRNT